MSDTAQIERSHLSLLLTPSWLSGVLAVFVGLMITVSVIVAFSLDTSTIQQQLLAWQGDKPQRALTTPDQVLPENDHPGLKESWPLIVIWAGVGLAVYAVAATIVRSFNQAEDLRESLEYVHAPRDQLIKEAVEHLAVRLLSLLLLVLMIIGFIKKVVPYSITAAHASATDLASLGGVLYAILSFAVIAISLHMTTILLRLAIGRARILSSS